MPLSCVATARCSRPVHGSRGAWTACPLTSQAGADGAVWPVEGWMPRTNPAAVLTEKAWKPATDSASQKDTPSKWSRSGKWVPARSATTWAKSPKASRTITQARARPRDFWLGRAAADLGLDGKVEPEQLGAMLTGRNPVDGEPFGLKSPPGREPVPGFDITFSAPKSVSLTWALGGHPVSGQVKEAHHAAVAEALSYMERNACWARRGKGGAQFVHGNGFLAAATSTAPRGPVIPSFIPTS